MIKLNYKKQEIKKGITFHNIKTEKFKTNLIAIFLTTPMSRKYVTFNSVLSSTLRRGSKNMPTQEDISKELEGMYGASFNCGLDKIGDNHILKFYIECLNDDFTLNSNEKMLNKSLEKIFELVFNPYTENGRFKDLYVEQEKENIKQRINAKVDNKALYAKARCVEEMYKGDPAGLYTYGYVEDLEKINSQNLYEYYNKLINECKIDIFVSGNTEFEASKASILENENYKSLKERQPNYIINNITTKEEQEQKYVEEKQNVGQGKIVIGCDLIFDEQDIKDKNLKYYALIYNGLLGGSANSKLFQNVREKASLAYTVSSNYVRFKSNIFINAGIEFENYDKTIKIIKEQLESLKNGEFTDEELENEKKSVLSGISLITENQDSELVYYFGQEIVNSNSSIEEYKKGIQNTSRENVLNIASKIKINTIYFLRN